LAFCCRIEGRFLGLQYECRIEVRKRGEWSNA